MQRESPSLRSTSHGKERTLPCPVCTVCPRCLYSSRKINTFHLCDCVRRWFMDASGVLMDVLWPGSVSEVAEVFAGTGQPFSCWVPPTLHLAALPAQVLVQVSFEEGQKRNVSAEYQSERVFDCSFLSWNSRISGHKWDMSELKIPCCFLALGMQPKQCFQAGRNKMLSSDNQVSWNLPVSSCWRWGRCYFTKLAKSGSFCSHEYFLAQGSPSWQTSNLCYEISSEVKREQLESPFILEHNQQGVFGLK